MKTPDVERVETSAAAKGAGQAHLRFWKYSDDSEAVPPLIRVSSGEKRPGEVKTIELQGGGCALGGYGDVPAGFLIVEAASTTDPGFASAVRKGFFLESQGAATVLVRQSNKGLIVEVIDDAAPMPGDVAIYNFLPTRFSEAHVMLGEMTEARLASGGGSMRLRGLPSQVYSAAFSARDSSGHNSRWINEINFRAYRRASLIIFLDAYGRVRGRVFPDEATGFGTSGDASPN